VSKLVMPRSKAACTMRVVSAAVRGANPMQPEHDPGDVDVAVAEPSAVHAPP
jgi:hypothetical protein